MKSESTSAKIALLLKLARIKFLLYSPILYTLGIALMPAGHGRIDMARYLIGLWFVWNTHIMTHLFNEYYDLEADRCNVNPSPWTGGSRVLVENVIAPITCLRLGYATMALSLLIAVSCFSGVVLSIAALIIVLCYSYSAPPLRLETRGLGESTVVTVLNLLVPLLGMTLQKGSLSESHFALLLIPMGIVGFVRMMVMNMADRKGDRMAGKLTLVVRIGAQRSVLAYMAGQALSYGFVLYLYAVQYISLAQCLWMVFTMPLGGWIVYRLWRGDWKTPARMGNLPFLASTHNALVASAVMVGLITANASWSWRDLCFFPLYLFFSVFLYRQMLVRIKPLLQRLDPKHA
jgi:1,4-dihydroxy-2-naphthoate polyprenyltransferase